MLCGKHCYGLTFGLINHSDHLLWVGITSYYTGMIPHGDVVAGADASAAFVVIRGDQSASALVTSSVICPLVGCCLKSLRHKTG